MDDPASTFWSDKQYQQRQYQRISYMYTSKTQQKVVDACKTHSQSRQFKL